MLTTCALLHMSVQLKQEDISISVIEKFFFHCQMSLLFRLLLETSRPYLNIIGQWIAAGQLCDPAREFVLQR